MKNKLLNKRTSICIGSSSEKKLLYLLKYTYKDKRKYKFHIKQICSLKRKRKIILYHSI